MKEITYEPPGTIILTVEHGSTLYGVTGDEGIDDLDLTSVVVEDPPYVTGLRTWDVHAARTAADGDRSALGDIDHTFYGLRKYVGLACQGNPSILSTLFAPLHKLHFSTDIGLSLQALSPCIISRQCIPRYRGYMRSQALRLLGEKGMGRGARTGARPELVAKYGYDTKFAMHMVRLGMQGVELATTGTLKLPMKGVDRDVAKAVRAGRWDVKEALTYAFSLDDELEKLQLTSELPAEPNYDAVNDWLHMAYTDCHLTRRSDSEVPEV